MKIVNRAAYILPFIFLIIGINHLHNSQPLCDQNIEEGKAVDTISTEALHRQWQKKLERNTEIYEDLRAEKLNMHPMKEMLTMRGDEIYRLHQHESFNPYEFIIEISKLKGDYQLRYWVYHPLWRCSPFKGQLKPPCFRALKSETRNINKKLWDEFKELIIHNEIWGLREHMDTAGLDGNLTSISGIYAGYEDPRIKELQLSSFNVTRWSPAEYQGVRKIADFLVSRAGVEKYYHP